MAVGYATPHGVAGDLDTLATSIAAKPNISAAVEVVDVPEVMRGRKAIKVTGTDANDVRAAVQSGVFKLNDGDSVSGNFTITVDGQTTANIAFNANAAAVVSALEALSTVEVGDVTVTGTGSVADPFILTFVGRNVDTGGEAYPVVTVTDVDLSGTPTITLPVTGVRILPGTSVA